MLPERPAGDHERSVGEPGPGDVCVRRSGRAQDCLRRFRGFACQRSLVPEGGTTSSS